VTGLLAARDVVEGRFTATTPVSTLLASDLSPLVGDRTVVELVSHTAGYLPNPQDLDVTTRPNEPAADYTRERLARCLGRPPCSVGGAMRGTYLYSNLGSGLLGVALADARDGGYEALVQERLAGPLGLVDTHLREASDLSRTVPGTTPTGEAVGPASMGVLAGAGELLSTTDDQLKLLTVLLDPPFDWRPVVELATSATTSTGAIAWGIDRVRVDGRLIFSKTGEQAGYSSIILWSQSEGVGVVAFTPVGRSSRTLAGLALEALRLARTP
jgi:CubicO group peptidase (beta-lactamase class C family)